MNPSTPGLPLPEAVWRRLLRGVVAIALALALTIITGLFVLSSLPAVRNLLAPLVTDERELPKLPLVLAVLFVILLPSILLFWPVIRRWIRSAGAKPVPAQEAPRRDSRGRFRWLSWPGLAVGWVLVTPVLLWLAHDDPAIRQSVSIEEFSPAFSGADRSYAVLMQYSKQTPSKEAEALDAVTLAVPAFGVQPADAAKWVEFVTANRAGLEADWVNLAPQRRWLNELAAFERIGDLTPADINANTVKFQAWRRLSYHLCASATLQALDGHGDDAMAMLLPLLEVSCRIQHSSRSLVRSMIGETSERLALQTATIILDRATVSAANRARLGAALAQQDAPALARRLVLVDYVVFAPAIFSMRLGDAVVSAQGVGSIARGPLNFLSALFLNPNATMNLYGDHVRELAALAEARDLGKLGVRSKEFGSDAELHLRMKNLGGQLLLQMAVPNYGKVLETHWKIADERDHLRRRLASPG